jgi:phosphate-selective porin OprO/OprP
MIDAALYDEDKNELGDGTEIRRARFRMEGTLYQDWQYKFSVDFADGDADIKSAYIGYNGFQPVRLTLGQFKEPFSLERQTSSKYITFMERALTVNAFAPGFSIGVGGRLNGELWSSALGIFGESYDDDAANEGDEGWGVTGRFTFAPFLEAKRRLHLGVGATYRQPDDSNKVRFSTKPESHVTEVRYADTGKIDNVDSLVELGLEGAVILGPFSMQGEYILSHLDRNGSSDDVSFDGWYLYGSWFVTGESRDYKSNKGVFGSVEPKSKYGAVELGARYSTINLNDGPITGGEEQNVTLGVNWHLNPQIRAMANYIFVNNDENADADGTLAGDDNPRIFQMRFQAAF